MLLVNLLPSSNKMPEIIVREDSCQLFVKVPNIKDTENRPVGKVTTHAGWQTDK
jgi:hypothetical protein